MTDLSAQDLDLLCCMPDWSAPYEIRDRQRFGRNATVERRANRLVRQGLAEYSLANHTYRITEAGRRALSTTSPTLRGE